MKTKMVSPIVCCIILLLQLSCNKYLDEKSDVTLVVPSTLADFQNLLDDGSTMNYSTPSFGASSADNFFIDNNAYKAKSLLMQHVYRWSPYPYRFINDWSFAYKAIYSTNLCLERIALVPRTTANAKEYDHIKGSALFYKAYHYLELAWVYAKAYDKSSSGTDLGIVLRDGTDILAPSVRATVEKTYQKIADDARQAASLLDDYPMVATRPSKCAAYALLARTYLSMRAYDSAGKYADLALQIRSNLMNYSDASVVSASASNPFKIFNAEVIFHATMSGFITLYHPTSGPARIDTTLYASYHVNDLRRKAFFTAVSGFQRFKGSYSGTASKVFSGIATDEVLLMRAECRARAGNKATALADLNRLLQQRFAPANFVPVTAATAEEALSIILQERRKELMFRGSLRWMDVKRLNKEGANITMKRMLANETFTLPPNDDRFALPLPEDVIATSGIKQN